MSTHKFEVIVHGPEGVISRKTFDTNEAGAKELTSRIDRGVASHKLIEGIEEAAETEKSAGKKKPTK
jgi:hypothetical protein